MNLMKMKKKNNRLLNRVGGSRNGYDIPRYNTDYVQLALESSHQRQRSRELSLTSVQMAYDQTIISRDSQSSPHSLTSKKLRRPKTDHQRRSSRSASWKERALKKEETWNLIKQPLGKRKRPIILKPQHQIKSIQSPTKTQISREQSFSLIFQNHRDSFLSNPGQSIISTGTDFCKTESVFKHHPASVGPLPEKAKTVIVSN